MWPTNWERSHQIHTRPLSEIHKDQLQCKHDDTDGLIFKKWSKDLDRQLREDSRQKDGAVIAGQIVGQRGNANWNHKWIQLCAHQNLESPHHQALAKTSRRLMRTYDRATEAAASQTFQKQFPSRLNRLQQSRHYLLFTQKRKLCVTRKASHAWWRWFWS